MRLLGSILSLRRLGHPFGRQTRDEQPPRPAAVNRLRSGLPAAVRALLLLPLLTPALAQRTVATRAQQPLPAAAVDQGPLPGSEPVTLTLRLGPSPAQQADLDQLLAAQLSTTSATYHHWLSVTDFAARFSPTDDQLAQLSTWLIAQGLTPGQLSPSRTRLEVSGTAAAVEAAFALELHRVLLDDVQAIRNTTDPVLPAALPNIVTGVDGLDTLPSATARIHLQGTPTATAHTTATVAADTLSALALAVDRNLLPVLTLSSTACAADLAPSEVSSFRAILEQAAAQGITLLTTSACAAADAAFPSALAESTALTLAPTTRSAASTSPDLRPSWQAATGLPADGLRHEPDFLVTSTDDLTTTIEALVAETGNRLGNLSSTLYTLAKTPGLFTSTAAAGTWTATEGLGSLSLARLRDAYPHGINATQVSLVSSSYALGYGDTFTLTAKVLPTTYATTNPTGTVTFTASTQGTIGSASIDSTGTATLTPDVLPAGTYSLTATYSGDSNYAGGSSTTRVTITISIVNARLTATIAPQTNVPYGATATVTATVTLPGANATPSGPVTAQIEGVTGAVTSATLSPNAGGNTATANIVVSMPSPGSYTVQVSCLGNTNYQCQTPVNLPITSIKGYTNTTVSVTPAAPQAGQPISLTATVANSGNGTGTYVYNGSVTFYDSGKLLATAPVATNQATTTLALSGNRTHNITAVYTGDSNWNTSTSGAVAVTPTILPDNLTLASNVTGSSSLSGVNIIFTATSTTTITYGTGPTGTITFFDTFNGAVVQLGNSATLVSNGPTASIALFSTTGLQPGTHRIYAVYAGDSNYAASTSAVLQLSLSDFAISMTPTTLTLAQGKSQQVTALIDTSGGFTGTVTLGCVPPSSSLSTCSFAPSSITGGGSTVLTITTTATSAALRPNGAGKPLFWPAAGVASLAALLFLVLPARARRLPNLLATLLLIVTLSTVGCGLGVSGDSTSGSSSGSSSGSTANNGTPLGTQNYTITAAGSDGVNTIRHTYQYQVTVQ